MTRKKTIELAAKLLSNSFGYVGGNHGKVGAFDFSIDSDGIDVFNADDEDSTFFWPEKVIHIVDTLNLTSYAYIQNYEEDKKRVVMRIH